MILTRSQAKAIIAAYDILCAAAIAALMLLAAPRVAWAYVDPSVMTYTIQALAGVAVALGAVAGVAFRRTRRALFRLLNIDENARKEHDPAWHRTDGAEEPAPVVRTAPKGADAKAAPATAAPKEPSWGRRFLLALLAVGFPAFTVGIVAPYEMVAGNADALSYSLSDVAGIMAAVIAGATVIVAALLSLLQGKAFRIAAILCVAGGVCFWMQAMFLNAGMPVMNGTPIDYWGQHAAMMVVSALAWLVVLAGAVFCAVKWPRIAKGAAIAIAAVLIVVQGVGVASLFAMRGFVTQNVHDGI